MIYHKNIETQLNIDDKGIYMKEIIQLYKSYFQVILHKIAFGKFQI